MMCEPFLSELCIDTTTTTTTTMTTNKKVVVYTYYSSPSSDCNLQWFLRKEVTYKPSVDYVIVANCDSSPPSSQPTPPPATILSQLITATTTLKNVTVLFRENRGFDFGGHAAALAHLDMSGRVYDLYYFMNSGVLGPLVPAYLWLEDATDARHWTNVFARKINEKVKLVGTTIVCLPHDDAGGFGPKVEGFFFMTDQLGLDLMKEERSIFCDHVDKYSAIVNGEYGLSRCIFRHGYSIDCMLHRYQNVDWTDVTNHSMNNHLHPSRKGSFYGQSVDPYEVIFHKWFWHGQVGVNLELVEGVINK